MKLKHNPYDAYRYDENFVLKINFLIIVIIVWSIHHLLLLLLAAASNSSEVFGAARDYAGYVPFVFSDVPGIIVLSASVNRTPSAGEKIRWVWANAAKILMLGLLISTAATIRFYKQEQQSILSLECLGFWVVLLNFVFVLYLYFSRQVKELFADFPLSEQEEITQ